MYKIIEPESYSFGESQTAFVKQSSRGLTGHDKAVLTKRAGHVFAETVSNIKLAGDEIPLHVIAIGATEKFSCNRNYDAFNRATCKAQHHTFVKNAKVYKNHKNKEPLKSYGCVKASAYNDEMDRIELLLAVNGSEKDAERNGNLFDSDLAHRIKSGQDIAVSMGCHVAHDVCNCCGNKAKNRSQYCTEDQCKYGGCRDNLGKIAADGTIVYVENPDADFFDISDVHRPADRTAYGGYASYLRKAASLNPMGGAALAEMYGMFDEVADEALVRQRKMAYLLAAEDKRLLDTWSREDIELSRAFATEIRPPMSFGRLGKIAADQLPALWNVLAGRKISMPVNEFLRVLTGLTGEKLATATQLTCDALPGVFVRLTKSAEMEDLLRHNPYLPEKRATATSWLKWAEDAETGYSIDPSTVREQAILSTLRGGKPALPIKQANSVREEVEQLAKHYALYKIAFLSAIEVEEMQIPLTARLAVIQNYIRH